MDKTDVKKPTSAKDYRKVLENYQKNRETMTVTVPSGAVFEVCRIKPAEAVGIFRAMGITAEDMKGIKDPDVQKEVGLKIMMDARAAAEALLPSFSRNPRVVLDGLLAGDALKVADIADGDIIDLMTALIRDAMGEEGTGKAQSFPGGPDDDGAAKPGKGL